MAGKLIHLTKSLLNVPQLITEDQFIVVSEFLNNRNSMSQLKDYADLQEKMGIGGSAYNKKSRETSVAMLNISGPLSHKATFMDALCGASSYESLAADYDELVKDPDVETIVLQIDSGGGEARGCFEFAQHLKNSKGDKKLIAYTDSLAASAAYAIAIAADEVIVSSDAEVGSIGVISQLVTRAKQLEEEGVKVETIFAGEGKDLGNPARDMTDTEREYLKTRIQVLYNEFVSHVSESRSLAQDFIIDSLGAKVYRGQDAVDKGLADKVMSFTEFANYLGDLEDGDAPLMNQTMETDNKMSKKENPVETPESNQVADQMAQLQEQLAALQEENSTLSAFAEQARKKETESMLASLEEKASAWEGFGVDAKAYAQAALEGSVPVEMLDKAMEGAQAALEAKEAQLEESASMAELGSSEESELITPEEQARKATRAALGQQETK